jgi:hypothetical protein
VFPLPPIGNINQANFGSITFRTYLDPVTAGCFVMHCHILNHEDIGMMQRVDGLPAPGQPSGCVPESMNYASLRRQAVCGQGQFPDLQCASTVATNFRQPDVTGKLEKSVHRHPAMGRTVTHALT